MRQGRTLLFTATASVLGALMFSAASLMLAGPASGSHTSPNWPDTVQTNTRALDHGAWVLEADVLDPHGEPVVGGTVRFGAEVDFFGARTVAIGETTTDAVGSAFLSYRPTWNGTHHLIAEALRADGSEVATRFDLEVSGVLPPIPADQRALPVTGSWALPAGIALIASVWLILGAIFIRTVVGIKRARLVPATHETSGAHQAGPPAAIESAARPSDRR